MIYYDYNKFQVLKFALKNLPELSVTLQNARNDFVNKVAS